MQWVVKKVATAESGWRWKETPTRKSGKRRERKSLEPFPDAQLAMQIPSDEDEDEEGKGREERAVGCECGCGEGMEGEG